MSILDKIAHGAGRAVGTAKTRYRQYQESAPSRKEEAERNQRLNDVERQQHLDRQISMRRREADLAEADARLARANAKKNKTLTGQRSSNHQNMGMNMDFDFMGSTDSLMGNMGGISRKGKKGNKGFKPW